MGGKGGSDSDNAALFGKLDFNPLMSVDLGYLNKVIFRFSNSIFMILFCQELKPQITFITIR